MAQAMFRQMAEGRAQVESAGVDPWDHLHPMAVRMMEERGLGLAGHYPKSAESVVGRVFDLVVTIGDPAREKIPASLVREARWIHLDIGDPADADDTPDSEAVFRRTADAISRQLPALLDELLAGARACTDQ